jgi:tubulin alpha
MPGTQAECCICLHIGQAGCQIGESVWELFCGEHGISPDGTNPSLNGEDVDNAYESFFNETSGGQFVPRAVFVDSDPASKDSIFAPDNPYHKLYHPDSVITYKQSCHSMFKIGMNMGTQCFLTEYSMDAIRRQVDLCDNLQGFFVFHSVGGGCGSGLGCSILEEMRDDFNKKVIFQPLLYPSRNLSSSIVEPYNCVFATAHIHSGGNNGHNGLTDLTLMFDNEAAYRVAETKLKCAKPNYKVLNRMIAQVISSCTTSLRYEAELGAALNEIVTNLVPQPQYRYCSVAYAPVHSKAHSDHESQETAAIIKELFEEHNTMCEMQDLRSNRYIAACVLLRGVEKMTSNPKDDRDMQKFRLPANDSKAQGTAGPGFCWQPIQVNTANKAIYELVHPKSHRQAVRFAPWNESGAFKVGIVAQRPFIPEGFEMAETNRAGAMIANSTAIRQVFVQQYCRFLKLWYKKSYVSTWGITCGVEEGEFDQAKETMRDIIDGYEDYLVECEEGENEAGSRSTLKGRTSRMHQSMMSDTRDTRHPHEES